jgi:hypothetical protein
MYMLMDISQYLAQAAITEGDNYDRIFIMQRVQHLFEAIGNLSDVVSVGNKVAIKINLTGGVPVMLTIIAYKV